MDGKELIAFLNKNITSAHEDFELYKKLFYNSPEIKTLLNNTAHNFFYKLEEILADRCIINISKLTDPYEQGNHKNLSMDLLRVIGIKESWPFLNKIEESLTQINEIAETIRAHRNKSMSHNDIETLERPWTLEPITIKSLDKAYTEIGNLMNMYYLETEGCTFDWYPKSPANVDSLLFYLNKGLNYEKQPSTDQ